MPYYIYRVASFAQLEMLAEFDSFQEASAHAKSLRSARAAEPGVRIKLMFADSPLQAQDQLLQVREPGPIGDD